MDLLDHFLLFFISLIANLFSAFAGGGAGLIQLPALIFLGLPFSLALATHKIASVFLGIGATIRNLKEKKLDLRFALFILGCGLPGVIVGANIIINIDNRHAEVALGLLTISLGVYSFFKSTLGLQAEHKNRHRSGMLIGGGILFLIGALNGSLTSGTGLFVTLWLVRWFGLEYKRAVSYTLILVGLFWNGTGALTLYLINDVAWEWLPALIIGSLIGGYLGAAMAIRFGSQWIKRVYEALTVLIGIKLIF